MAQGGRRPGAGRPRGRTGKQKKTIAQTLKREALKAYFDRQAAIEFAPVLAQYFARAKGQPTEADPRILVDFLNRVLGKPPESVEFGAGAGGAVTVRIVHQQLAT